MDIRYGFAVFNYLPEETLRDLLSTIGTVVKLEMRPPKQQSKRITAMAEMSSEKEV